MKACRGDRSGKNGKGMKKKEPIHFVQAEMMADYLDEHDGEIPHDSDYREPNVLNYGCAGIDDIDSMIEKIYDDL